MVAAELHKEGLQRTMDEVIQKSGRNLDPVSVIAVTTGPGLAPSLKEGLLFAKELVRRTG